MIPLFVSSHYISKTTVNWDIGIESEVMTVIAPTNETFDYTFLKSDVIVELTLLPLDDGIIIN
jgi:hypothetical protein